MELRHLRYFVRVAEDENVSRAALKLHLSQPALSRQIRDLEEEIGFPLFERSAKSVRLTEAGRAFLPEARAVLERTEQAVKAAREVAMGSGSELHVGYAPSLTARILPRTLRAFQAKLPTIHVKLHDLTTEEMLAGLRDGTLQVGFVMRLTSALLRGLQFEELMRDPIRVGVAPKHRFARRGALTLLKIAKEPLISYNRKEYPDAYENLLTIFRTIKTRPRIAEEHDSVNSLITAVESGAGITITPASLACTAGPRLKFVRLSPEPKPLVIGAAWRNNGLTAAGEQFLQCARNAEHDIK
jgi:DNA-binding transcriptional LysR family regulator